MQHAGAFRKVIVTGANKGIGYAIVKGLYADPDPFHIILAARDIGRGEEAMAKLKQEIPQSNNKVEFQQLEVNDSKSIDNFVAWVKNHLKQFDVLVNNAGYGYLKQTPEEGTLTLKTNVYAPIELTEKLLPYLSDEGKIVQISSLVGGLSFQGEKIQQRLKGPNLSREELFAIADELSEKVKETKYEALGWNSQHYHNSKCLLNAYTKFVLPKLLKDGQNCYNATPGYCKTDMTPPDAPRSADEGAKTPILTIKLPAVKGQNLYRGYYEDEKLVETYE